MQVTVNDPNCPGLCDLRTIGEIEIVEKSWIDPSLFRFVPKANTPSNDKPTSDDHLQIEKERTKRSEQDRQRALFELKRSMVERGFSVDEIRSISS